MQISMVLSQARGSEVKGLSDKDKTDTLLIGYINLALVALYTKFMIKTEEAIIELHDNKTLYTLDSSDSDVTVGDLPMADNDLISIIGAFDELGTSLPINDTTCTISIFTPSYNTVQIPYGAEDTYISLIYQQNPILLNTSTLCDADGVLLFNADGTPNYGWPTRGRGRPNLGEIKFEDLNDDGNIDSDDKYFAGQRYPKLSVGIHGGFQYKGFDFYVQTNASMGNQIYIEVHNRNANAFGEGAHLDVSTYGSWTGEGSPNLANYPALASDGQNEVTQFSDHTLYDGDYFRIKAVNIGYTFKSDFVKKLGLGSIRIYTSGYNLLTFTKFPGFDPELGSDVMHDNYSLAGFQRPYPYTNPKSFSGGIQIDF